MDPANAIRARAMEAMEASASGVGSHQDAPTQWASGLASMKWGGEIFEMAPIENRAAPSGAMISQFISGEPDQTESDTSGSGPGLWVDQAPGQVKGLRGPPIGSVGGGAALINPVRPGAGALAMQQHPMQHRPPAVAKRPRLAGGGMGGGFSITSQQGGVLPDQQPADMQQPALSALPTVYVTLNAEQGTSLLLNTRYIGAGPRPLHLPLPVSSNFGRLFKEEIPKNGRRRKKGSDTWNYKSAAVDLWPDQGEYGVRKQHGNIYIVCGGSSITCRAVSYKLIRRSQVPGRRADLIVSSGVLHHIPSDQSDYLPSNVPHPEADALTELRLFGTIDKFISFKDAAGAERGFLKLGPQGVTLVSSTGDFAEWHRRAAAEPPMQAGDVVGFDGSGRLTRTTSRRGMTGVISERAIIEGSLPSAGADRSCFHLVAYCGR